MTDQDYRSTIAHNWFVKGEETYVEAEILFKNDRMIGCVNRLYYAVFYAVSAALAKDGTEYGKHSAVRASLHRDYIKTGRVPEKCSKIYDELFEDRQQGDYTPTTSFNKEDLQTLLEETRYFLNCFKKLI